MTGSDQAVVRHSFVEADGVRVFYREAGAPDAPPLLLLHGFPASSHQFRRLMPALAGRFRVVAPDLPGFGFTEVPPERGYEFGFADLARTLGAFVDAVGLVRFALYVFDFGASVGLRLALDRPGAVTAFISQNGNAYEEGLTEGWGPIRAYWSDPSPAHRQALADALLNAESVRWQYEHGEPEPERIAPEAPVLGALLLERPGVKAAMLDLIFNYQTNLALYPRFQAWLRTHRPPTLVVWGRNDPFFGPAGAEAFRRDVPDAAVELLDAGHFALETRGDLIAARIRAFLLDVGAA